MDLWRKGKEAVALGDTADAVECFRQLVKQEPWEPAHHWSLGMALLSVGDYQRGFAEIEWRWHPYLNANAFDKALFARGVLRWQGEFLAEKSIVLFHEWGFGDAIMMLRYLPMIRQIAKSVTVVLPTLLCRLASCDGVRVVDELPNDHFDFRCPLYSLPPIFGIDSGPYLSPSQTLIDWWRFRLSAANASNDRRKMGIAWSGSKTNQRDAVRSLALDEFLRLLNHNDYDLYSLQATEKDIARRCGVTTFYFDDFADTAALMSLMDCVVTVDTAAAHLAGAIGHPNAVVMLDYAQDWRWYRGDEWYPTLNKCRQPSLGDWAGAFDKWQRQPPSVHGINGTARRAGAIAPICS